MDVPETRYARNGDEHIANQVFGDGPDLLLYMGIPISIASWPPCCSPTSSRRRADGEAWRSRVARPDIRARMGRDPLTYHGPPPLVIEVVSDPRRDRIKRARYEQYGVPEYWAVLPDAEQVQVFELGEQRYTAPVVYEAPGTVSPLVLPELVVDLGEIFAGDE